MDGYSYDYTIYFIDEYCFMGRFISLNASPAENFLFMRPKDLILEEELMSYLKVILFLDR